MSVLFAKKTQVLMLKSLSDASPHDPSTITWHLGGGSTIHPAWDTEIPLLIIKGRVTKGGSYSM